MTTCAACGRGWPDGQAYCGACGCPLPGAPADVVDRPAQCGSQQPQEPTVVNVRVVNSFWESCLGCFSLVVGILVIVFVAAWLFSGC